MAPIAIAVLVGVGAVLVGLGMSASSAAGTPAAKRTKRAKDEAQGREYRLYIGQQKSGKTYQLLREVDAFAAAGCKVFILDVFRGFREAGEVFRSRAEWDAWCAKDNTIPQVSVFQLGEDAAAYDWVIDELCAEADPHLDATTVLVCDEFWQFAPMGSQWRGSPRLREVLLAGRHVWNAAGEECEVHVIGATQYPYSMHLLVWQQAYTVFVGATRGARISHWLKNEFGGSTAEAAKYVENRQWFTVWDRDRRQSDFFTNRHPRLVS